MLLEAGFCLALVVRTPFATPSASHTIAQFMANHGKISEDSGLDRVVRGEGGMDRHTKFFMVVVLTAGLSGMYGYGTTALYGQEPNPTAQMPGKDQPQIEKQDNGIYLYRVKVVQ